MCGDILQIKVSQDSFVRDLQLISNELNRMFQVTFISPVMIKSDHVRCTIDIEINIIQHFLYYMISIYLIIQ